MGTRFLLLLLTAGLLALAACDGNDVILATTTSAQDSGLLDELVPAFEKQTDYRLKPIVVGSGQALELGKQGEADVLLVHSPQDEEAFMAEGYGSDRRLVMYNDFVFVGPAKDPASIRGMKSAADALKAIAAEKALFVSRGDDSGTHKLERKLWGQAGIGPSGESWYQEAGAGMGQTLLIASDKQGYTISDRATFLRLRDNLSLEVLAEGDKALLNIYHVIIVNPARHREVNEEGARAFADFLVSPATQDLIANFGVQEFGQPLFFAAAGRDEKTLGQ